MNEGSRHATLKNIRADNARLTGTKVYDDGVSQEFNAVFGNRVLNGESTFGLLVETNWEVSSGVTLQKVFFRRE